MTNRSRMDVWLEALDRYTAAWRLTGRLSLCDGIADALEQLKGTADRLEAARADLHDSDDERCYALYTDHGLLAPRFAARLSDLAQRIDVIVRSIDWRAGGRRRDDIGAIVVRITAYDETDPCSSGMNHTVSIG